MPIRAIRDGKDVYATNMSDSVWLEVRETYKKYPLTLPCCGAVAIPKVRYEYGTCFFAHKAKGGCTFYAPETRQHIEAKNIIRDAAMESGWRATTEARMVWPFEGLAIADVLCKKGHDLLSDKYFDCVAFEIQLSPQNDVTTRQRNLNYINGGAEVVHWFFYSPPRYLYQTEHLKFYKVSEEDGKFWINDNPDLDLVTVVSNILRVGHISGKTEEQRRVEELQKAEEERLRILQEDEEEKQYQIELQEARKKAREEAKNRKKVIEDIPVGKNVIERGPYFYCAFCGTRMKMTRIFSHGLHYTCECGQSEHFLK